MGFFSWNCKACGHSVLSAYATNEINVWMKNAVVLTSDGELCRGEYDGYGCVGSYDYNDFGGDPEMYHEACWNIVGKPTEFSGASESSRDQGYFFDEKAHNVYEPQNERDLYNIRASGLLAEENCCQNWKILMLESDIHRTKEFINGELDDKERERFINNINTIVENMERERQERKAKEEVEKDERIKEDWVEILDNTEESSVVRVTGPAFTPQHKSLIENLQDKELQVIPVKGGYNYIGYFLYPSEVELVSGNAAPEGEVIVPGDLVRDSYGRKGIVYKECRECIYEACWHCLPLGGGGVHSSHELTQVLGKPTDEDLLEAHQHANAFGQEEIEELYPHIKELAKKVG